MNTPSQRREIPDKLFFRIGEVSRIAGVPASVLRFWEGEFPRINPRRTDSGQRVYRRKDVELILHVKRLLYDEKFTIKGARQHLKNRSGTPVPKMHPDLIDDIKAELEEIRNLLK